MLISKKTQYSLRAIFELGKHYGRGPIKIAEIAETQAIPEGFLEVILNQLKQGKFVDSKRGSAGGYFLVKTPGSLAVGEVIRYMNGPMHPVDCMTDGVKGCSLYGNCAFLPMWEKVGGAMANVFDKTSFQNLIDAERSRDRESAFTYSI